MAKSASHRPANDLPPEPGPEPEAADVLLKTMPKVDEITARTLASAHEIGYREGYADALTYALYAMLLAFGIVMLTRSFGKECQT